MTNIFYKKDGLTDAVKSVMEVNQFHREAEAQVNEMFGVVSRKALPHEQQASWDAEFNKIISEGAMKRMSMGDDGGMKTYKEKPKGYSPKQMMMAKIAGDPKKIDAKDLAALRAGKKMDEEEQIDEAKKDMYHKHMLKALGKSRLPKDHQYTSSIAQNGDFVVKDGGGRTAGRIPAGEHNLKEMMDKENQIDEMDALDKKRMTSTAAQVNKAGKSDSAPEIRRAAGAIQRSRVNIDKASDRLDHGGEMSGPTPKKVAIEEKVRNKYAIGMAAAMKSTGDEPPLKKSTIKKAHEIAKKIDERVMPQPMPARSMSPRPAFSAGAGAKFTGANAPSTPVQRAAIARGGSSAKAALTANKQKVNVGGKSNYAGPRTQNVGKGNLGGNVSTVRPTGGASSMQKNMQETLNSIQEEIAMNLYAELNYVMEQYGEEAANEWIANLSEEQLAIMENM